MSVSMIDDTSAERSEKVVCAQGGVSEPIQVSSQADFMIVESSQWAMDEFPSDYRNTNNSQLIDK